MLDTHGLGFTKSNAENLFIKSDTVEFGSSKFKIRNMNFVSLIQNLVLVKFDVQEDEFQNIFLMAQWEAPQLLASGNYIDGQNKGSVKINASEFFINLMNIFHDEHVIE